MRYGRNKATAILVDLAATTKKSLSERMAAGPFTISTDGSNDETDKQFPLVVRTVDPEMTVNSELLSVPICDGLATGKNIFDLIDAEFQKRNIPWENCLSLGCDNANIMTGHKKGVYAFVKEKQPQVFLSGCSVHLVHIAARKAADVLPAIDDALVDIYFYFNKSEKRKMAFKGTQLLHNVDQKKMLKHVCTRWLSIGRCIDRLLENWDPLKVYFREQKELQDSRKKSKGVQVNKSMAGEKPVLSGGYMEQSYAEQKVKAIYEFVRSPTNKLYVMFLKYTIKVFDETLTSLQAEDPRTHTLRRSLHRLLRNLLTRFVKPSAMTGKLADEVDYQSKHCQKNNRDILIGSEATEFFNNKEDNHLREKRVNEFFSNVRCYFTTACDYIKKKLPLNKPLLKHAEVADVSLKETASLQSLLFFVDKYPCLSTGVDRDALIEQFSLYQSYNIEACKRERVDETWREIGHLKDGYGVSVFDKLSKVMLGILTIPHSSAHCERIFSTVRKTRTDQRASLQDKTLESLLVLKARSGDRGHDVEELRRLKGSYYRSLKD